MIPRRVAERDLVAALPQRLLAHPRGPVAYVGHVDMAWLLGFADPENLGVIDRWDARFTPFKAAVDALLSARPVGQAMVEMSCTYHLCNAQLTRIHDELQTRRRKLADVETQLADAFIRRGDAQNFLVLGDPAARARIPAAG